MEFDVDYADFDVDFANFTDLGLKLVKLTISFHSTVRIQGDPRFCRNQQNSTFSLKGTTSKRNSM